MLRLFLLGTLFLIRTASEKVFLIGTTHVKYVGNKILSLNELFSCPNMKIFLYVRDKKCSLTNEL